MNLTTPTHKSYPFDARLRFQVSVVPPLRLTGSIVDESPSIIPTCAESLVSIFQRSPRQVSQLRRSSPALLTLFFQSNLDWILVIKPNMRNGCSSK
jgi:hypothetical protein